MSAWTLPDGLNQPLPRRVATKRSLWWALLLMFGFALAISLFCAWILHSLIRQDYAFRAIAVRATGTIVGLHTAPYRNGLIYSVDYRYQFPADNGAPPSPIYSGSGETIESIYSQLTVGQRVPIAYDPDRPSVSRLNFNDVVYRDGMPPITVALISSGPLLLAPPTGLILILIYLRERWLLRWGKAAEATIIRQYQYSLGRAGQRTAIVYSFIDDYGQTVEGVRKGLAANLDPEKYREIFDNPTVLFDPRQGVRNKLYPMDYAECFSPWDELANPKREV